MIDLSDDEMKAILQTVRDNPTAEGRFFADARFFPGRLSDPQTKKVIQPQESMRIYEHRLAQIKRVEPRRYKKMHKGTPFYFIGWLAYEMRDYEKGVFYMDAALSEDVKNCPSEWTEFPAASFIFLDVKNTSASAHGITVQLKEMVDSQLECFSQAAEITLDTNMLIEKFIRHRAENASFRSIITSLLTFLLESKDLKQCLELRSSCGGTIEPFLTHLFKGGLIFESLLKRRYGKEGDNTLGGYLYKAKTDLGLAENPLYKKHNQSYTLDELPDLLKKWEKENFQEKAVAIAYAVRNTAGHDLAWNDIFKNGVYDKLYKGIVNAIFWTIYKLHVEIHPPSTSSPNN